MADKMSATRPDMKSYSRISYLREIYGDYPGAIEAMNMAVDAGLPGLEQTEWCRYQLGHLYENTGDLTKAQYCYDQSIYLRPSFSWSYAGKARIEKSLGNYFKAISYLKQAQVLLADFSFQQELTELYRITNQQDLAAVSARKTIELLGGLNPEESKNYHGHYADKELAYACIDAYDYLNAYKHALIEYNRRPNNIDVNQAMAWINYKLGKYESANGYADAALRTHSKNPLLNYQAGLIKIKNGDKESGEKLIKQALLINPYMSLAMKWEKHPLLALK
jgi:tetratricopeptide (TPR) repeat protein